MTHNSYHWTWTTGLGKWKTKKKKVSVTRQWLLFECTANYCAKNKTLQLLEPLILDMYGVNIIYAQQIIIIKVFVHDSTDHPNTWQLSLSEIISRSMAPPRLALLTEIIKRMLRHNDDAIQLKWTSSQWCVTVGKTARVAIIITHFTVPMALDLADWPVWPTQEARERELTRIGLSWLVHIRRVQACTNDANPMVQTTNTVCPTKTVCFNL